VLCNCLVGSRATDAPHARRLGGAAGDHSSRRILRRRITWGDGRLGQRESAGKNKSARTRKGSPSLRTALTECAYAASRSKGTYLSEHFPQVRRRRGQNRAIVATSHEILTTAWWLLSTNRPYEDPARRHSIAATSTTLATAPSGNSSDSASLSHSLPQHDLIAPDRPPWCRPSR